MIKPKKIVVIGGNAAGPAAAAKAKRVNPDAEVTMFEAGEFISTGTCEIPYVLSDEIESYKKIILFNEGSFKEEKKVNVFVNHLAESIDAKNKFILIRNLKNNTELQFEYDSLVIAAGSTCKIPPQFTQNYNNVFTLKNISDLIKIQNYLKNKKVENILIIGSGYIGLEAAEALIKKKYNVTILEKDILPLPLADTEIQKKIVEIIEKNNIRFLGGVQNFKLVVENNSVHKINIDGRLIDVDLVLLATGFKPNNILAKKSKINLGGFGGISVDRKLETSITSIYAAGDCIEVINDITLKPFYLPLATLAHEYGHIAGANSAGEFNRVEPVVKNISVKIFNKFNVIVGLTSKEAREHNYFFNEASASVPNLVKVMPNSGKVFGKIIFESNSRKILGASFIGGKEVSGYGDIISTLIKTNQTIDILEKINFNYTPPLSPIINLLSALSKKA